MESHRRKKSWGKTSHWLMTMTSAKLDTLKRWTYGFTK